MRRSDKKKKRLRLSDYSMFEINDGSVITQKKNNSRLNNISSGQKLSSGKMNFSSKINSRLNVKRDDFLPEKGNERRSSLSFIDKIKRRSTKKVLNLGKKMK